MGAGFGWFVYRSSPKMGQVPRHQGMDQPIKPFRLPDASGQIRALDDFKGNVILVHFWAAWCAPCVEEIPQIVAFAKQWEKHPVKVVAVNLDKSWEEAHTILPSKDLPSNLISVIDLESRVAELYGSYQYPETYLIGKDLKIQMKWIGPQNWGSPAWKPLLERFL